MISQDICESAAAPFEFKRNAEPDTLEVDSRLPYFEIMDDVVGTLADQQRHVVARIALLNELRMDPVLNAVLLVISEKSGIRAKRFAALEAKCKLANIIGVEPHCVLNVKQWPMSRLGRKRVSILKAGGQLVSNFNDFSNSLEARAPAVVRILLRLTREHWKLNYAWLPLEMLSMFISAELDFFYYESTSVIYSLADPVIDEEIVIPAGTPTSLALNALKSKIAIVENKLRSRRQTEQDEKRIQRNVRWFYLHKMKGQSVRSLGLEYHNREHPEKTKCGGDRAQIQHGIDEAERLLALGGYHIPSVPNTAKHSAQ